MSEIQNNIYTIKQGDNLWNISGGNWDKINKICMANNIQNPDCIFAGNTIDISCLSDSFSSETNDDNAYNITKGQEYRKWLASEENQNKLLSGNINDIPEFEAFSFNRNDVKDKPVQEQINTYFNKMSEFAGSVIDTVDDDEKDGKLNFGEFVNLSSDGQFNEQQLKEASDIIAKYDVSDKDGNKTPNGELERQEIAQYVKDKYNKDIDNIDFEEFEKYTNEFTDLMAKSKINNLYTENFKNIAGNDSDKDTISKEEFTAFLTMHDIDWKELNADSNKKVLDVVDGKLNFFDSQTKIADPSSSDYKNQTQYLKDLYNSLYGQ